MTYKVVITDLEHPTIEPELEILAVIGVEPEWHDCRTEKDVIRVGADADVVSLGTTSRGTPVLVHRRGTQPWSPCRPDRSGSPAAKSKAVQFSLRRSGDGLDP